MKLGVLTVPLRDMPAEEAFTYLAGLGVESVELGTGGYTNKNHLDPDIYLHSDEKVSEMKALLARLGLTISGLSCHGNPVHPDKEIAARDHKTFEDTCALAEKFGIDTVITFSGCPGGGPDAKYPNWVTCVWPTDFQKILEYQWNEVLIPYWKNAAEIAKRHGVRKIAFEMHPGFCVYNAATLLKLRAAVGDIIGANFDPSHLIWQGTDPKAAIRALKGAIYHFHAKDTYVDPYNTAVNGVLDTTGALFGDAGSRSWLFRTVGYGTGEKQWRDIISALSEVGYDGAISIEHEDCLMTAREGLERAIAFLKTVIISDSASRDGFWI